MTVKTDGIFKTQGQGASYWVLGDLSENRVENPVLLGRL